MGDYRRAGPRGRATQAREVAAGRLRAMLGGSDGQAAGPGAAEPESAGGTTWRVDPGRRGALAVLVAVSVVGAVIGWRVVADRPEARSVPVSANLAAPSPALSAGRTTAGSAASSGEARTSRASSPTQVVVDVVGRVRRPGIVRLAAGSRVDDALRAAGGVVPGTDVTSLNLARILVDGEQVAVGVPAATSGGATAGSGAPGGGGDGSATGAAAKVNLNTATVEQLDALPGVGPVLAQRIVDWRTTHGRFDSVDQLNQVSGVGDAKFADISPLVTV